MKRDWDVIREILIRVEEINPSQGNLQLSAFAPERAAEISYHAELLIEAGLVKGSVLKVQSGGPRQFNLTALTWSGHELLDAIRDDTVWRKAKKLFLEKSISMTFDLVKSVAAEIAKNAIGG